MSDAGDRHRRGRLPRVLAVAVLAVVVLVLLFTVVFPWFDATFVNDPVLGTAGVHAD